MSKFIYPADSTSKPITSDISMCPQTGNWKLYNEDTANWTILSKPSVSPKIVTEDMLKTALQDQSKLLLTFLKSQNIDIDLENFEDFLSSIELADKLNKKD